MAGGGSEERSKVEKMRELRAGREDEERSEGR